MEVPAMQHWTRPRAIARIRERLLELVDDQHSVCEVAARLGIFCKGFRHFSDAELRERFSWLAHPEMSREDLEKRANSYLLGRTEALDCALACDAQTEERDVCLGWDEFSNADLARFAEQLLGEPTEVTGDAE
jgi:hypothetical protein